MRTIIGALATASLLVNSLPALAERPAAAVAEGWTATATVEAVNYDTREVILQRADGVRFTFQADPEVRDFDRIQAGDKVTATYCQGLVIYVLPPGGVALSSETESTARAAPGGKPAGSYTRNVNVSATVEALDVDSRNVTLRCPKGNRITLRVGDHVKNLDEVKVGDLVNAGYTESIDIAVTEP